MIHMRVLIARVNLKKWVTTKVVVNQHTTARVGCYMIGAGVHLYVYITEKPVTSK